ncbi:MAG: outer membrane protein assembly factor BamA [Rhodothermales bacterium]
MITHKAHPGALTEKCFWEAFCMMGFRFLFVVFFCLMSQSAPAQFRGSDTQLSDAQASAGQGTYIISRIEVEGTSNERTQLFLARASGLRIGQEVTLPNDPVFAVAIRSIYRLEQFSHVEIKQKEINGRVLHVVINVVPFPKLGAYTLKGISGKDEKELRRMLFLVQSSTVTPADIERAQRTIKLFLTEKGYHLAEVEVTRKSRPSETSAEELVDLQFDVDSGPMVRIRQVSINGNEALSDREITRILETKKRTWWRFWEKARFDKSLFEEDLEKMLSYMHEKGFYNARILRDSVWLDTSLETPGLNVAIDIYEGQPYFIKSIQWEGNTLFEDDLLTNWLGVHPGDRYNLTRLQENLYGNTQGGDVSSRYMNLGYMRFSVEPKVSVTGTDSLNLIFDVQEGDAYSFGDIEITGNHTTNDHVVRRELFSIPGERFSRAAIQESIRRLMQAGLFSEQSISQGPGISVDDVKKEVNLRFEIEESNFPRPQLTGSIGQFGLVLGVTMGYNNFSMQNVLKKSAWRPLPSGDGQQIGLNVQANGAAYQQYGFNFTEPWFRSKPAPLGFSSSYTHIGADAVSSTLSGSFDVFSARVFHERRLKWPSPFFNIGTAVEYRNLNNTIYEELPNGSNQQIEVTQSISRNTTNHPVFATQGSHNRLSVEVGVPIDDFIQYHKWRFQSSWNVPLLKNRRLSLNIGADLGYIGSLGNAPVEFERFVLGGSPLDSQGITTTPILGTEVVYFRGYPLGAFGAQDGSGLTGRRILTKYASEFRWMAVKQPQIQVMPYAFFDAANTWNSFDDVKAGSLFRSAGLGIRMTVPMLGLLDVVYGRNLDAYTPPDGSNKSGLPGWGLQFSIGRSFNF